MYYNILMYILQVFPLKKLPFKQSKPLSYFYSTKINIGCLVSIPIKNKFQLGIVVDCKLNYEINNTNQNFKIKFIEEIFSEIPLLTVNQLKLAIWISKKYAYSTSDILKNFLPKINSKFKIYPKILNQEFSNTVEINSNKFQVKTFLADYKERLVYYKKIITSSQNQIIIFVPDQITLDRLTLDLKEFQPTIFSNNISTKKYREIWMKIKLNEIKLIICTKNGLFLPFNNPEAFIIENEPSESYYENSPKLSYSSQDIINKLALIYNTNLILTGNFYPINTYNLLSKSKISIPKFFHPNWEDKSLEIIRMHNEYKLGLYGIISNQLIDNINIALKNNVPIIIFVNRKGESTYIFCEKCGFHLKDPYSNTLLSTHNTDLLDKKPKDYTDSKVLVSHKSNRWFKMIYNCPKCDNELTFSGMGIEKVHKMIQEKYPSIKTEILNNDFANDLDSQIQIIQNLIENKTKIIFATQMFRKFLPDFKIKPIIIIPSFEALLSLPQYNTIEKSTQFLIDCFIYSEKTVIQTFQELKEEQKTPILGLLTNKNFDEIWQDEIDIRKKLEYPPFSEIILLSSSHHIREKAIEQALRTKNVLRKLGLKPIGPIENFSNIGKGKFILSLIIKANSKNADKIKQQLLPVLEINQYLSINPLQFI